MAAETQAHRTDLSFVKAAPAELYAGADMALKIKVSCPSNCSLQGDIVRIDDESGAVVKEVELISFDGAANETDEFVVKAPAKAGEYTWRAVFTCHDKEENPHEESSAAFSFVVKPHTTSMAVWDVPSPVAFSSSFRFKVGVRCSVECALAGKEIAIYDHEGTQVATAALGESRWSKTGALYWAEVEVKAPDTEERYTWEARFSDSELELPHEGSSHIFGIRTAKPPEHVVTIEAVAKDSNAPITHAAVILQAYRDYTDDRGLARLMVPKGEYALYVSAEDMLTFQTSVKVASDVTIRAELLLAPVEDTSG